MSSVLTRSLLTARCCCGTLATSRSSSSARSIISKRNASLTAVAEVPATLKGLDSAYELALGIMEGERQAVTKRIEELEKEVESTKAAGGEIPGSIMNQLETARYSLAISKPENHYAFRSEKVDLREEPFATMHRQRWQRHGIPRLERALTELNIVEEALAQPVKPTVNVEVKYPFGRPKVTGLHGLNYAPCRTIYSPKVVITTDTDNVRHFTLMLIDLDRPNLNSKSYEQWIHWMITDLPVHKKLEIPGGSSPFLGPPTGTLPPNASRFVPRGPEEEPTLPGNVIFPYVPPHPALQNPKKAHRMFLVALEQKGEKLEIDMEAVRAKAKEEYAEAERKARKSDQTWAFEAVGEGERRIGVRERAALGTLGKVMETYDLELKGYGIFTSHYDVTAPEVFSRLGIHEPVYGRLSQGLSLPKQIRRIDTATELVSKLPAHIASLSPEAIQHVNEVKVPLKPIPHLPTRRSKYVDEMRQQDADAAAAKAAKEADNKNEKKEKKVVVNPRVEKGKGGRIERGERWVHSEKLSRTTLPRVSLLAAVGLVKSKEGDVAKGFRGALWKRVKGKRNMYKNM